MDPPIEYTVVNLPGATIPDEEASRHQAILNQLGLDGWVLVTIDSGFAYLKKEIQ